MQARRLSGYGGSEREAELMETDVGALPYAIVSWGVRCRCRSATLQRWAVWSASALLWVWGGLVLLSHGLHPALVLVLRHLLVLRAVPERPPGATWPGSLRYCRTCEYGGPRVGSRCPVCATPGLFPIFISSSARLLKHFQELLGRQLLVDCLDMDS